MRVPRLRRHLVSPAIRAALRVTLGLALVWLAAVPAPAAPQASAKELYLSAQTREQAVRAALDASPPNPPPTRDAMRQVAAAYRQVVLRYPTSGYCDNALWLAAQLSADAFVRHGDERDRAAALQLLMSLTSEYPGSPLVPKARADAARIMALAAPAPDDRPADAAAPQGVVLLRDVRRRGTATGGVIEIELDGPVQYREEHLYNPNRIFFDLSKTRTTDALKDATLSFESGPIRQVRIGRHPNSMTRVVMDMADGVRCGSRLASAPPRLVVTCGDAAAPGAAAEPAPAPPSERPSPDAASTTAAAPVTASPKPIAKAPGAADPAPAAPSANGRGGFSMARQLGLRVGRIVIDAGHGGRDPGAQGPGYTEAALTLDIALRLERLLAKEPGVEVVLTRRTDEYVALQERTAIANREGADLFVSIHANASRNRSARGVESYLLNFASTPEAAAVAARENASSTLTMSHLNDLVKQIALNSKLDESRDLARHIQTAMVRKLRASNKQVRDLGVKQAPFVVLVGASMPSVLVEVSFLSHTQEGRLLGTGAYRQRIAEALLDGVRRYLRTLKRAVTDTADGAPMTGGDSRDRLQ
ncbi:MAG: N-acetylmuramoyl-L-alanine amidase [Vicinamibacterales bacterium]|nr:N-acetylmuramoyl-L-alanine amidase [Vicinamibacterales bacterium]